MRFIKDYSVGISAHNENKMTDSVQNSAKGLEMTCF